MVAQEAEAGGYLQFMAAKFQAAVAINVRLCRHTDRQADRQGDKDRLLSSNNVRKSLVVCSLKISQILLGIPFKPLNQ